MNGPPAPVRVRLAGRESNFNDVLAGSGVPRAPGSQADGPGPMVPPWRPSDFALYPRQSAQVIALQGIHFEKPLAIIKSPTDGS